MSWLFSQALVEEYLGDICSDGKPSAQSNGNHTQQAYCSPDKMTDFSRLSRFGMMFKPLTESRGEELLMLFRADFPVKTYPLQGGGKASKESGQECGERWHGLLAKYDPDTHSLKTVQCSLLEDLNESLQTWPRWGLMQDGVCWEQTMLALPTKEKESGYWLTPSTVDIAIRSRESMIKRLEYRKKLGRNGVGAGCLSEQVEWSGTGNPIGYMTAEKLFPTPTTRDYKGARTPEAMKKTGRNPMTNSLPDAVENQGEDGKLNPMWVEWLMGWPLGWTELKPLEMDKYHKWQHLHGKS
jgi:hypothetical protein